MCSVQTGPFWMPNKTEVQARISEKTFVLRLRNGSRFQFFAIFAVDIGGFARLNVYEWFALIDLYHALIITRQRYSVYTCSTYQCKDNNDNQNKHGAIHCQSFQVICIANAMARWTSAFEDIYRSVNKFIIIIIIHYYHIIIHHIWCTKGIVLRYIQENIIST